MKNYLLRLFAPIGWEAAEPFWIKPSDGADRSPLRQLRPETVLRVARAREIRTENYLEDDEYLVWRNHDHLWAAPCGLRTPDTTVEALLATLEGGA